MNYGEMQHFQLLTKNEINEATRKHSPYFCNIINIHL